MLLTWRIGSLRIGATGKKLIGRIACYQSGIDCYLLDVPTTRYSRVFYLWQISRMSHWFKKSWNCVTAGFDDQFKNKVAEVKRTAWNCLGRQKCQEWFISWASFGRWTLLLKATIEPFESQTFQLGSWKSSGQLGVKNMPTKKDLQTFGNNVHYILQGAGYRGNMALGHSGAYVHLKIHFLS